MAGKKRNVQFSKPEEPNFIKQFKERLGYKQGDTVETKRQDLDLPEDPNELPDELPTVVVLDKGDLTQEEADKVLQEQSTAESSEAPPADGKILFKKPSKRQGEDDNLNISSSKKKKESDTSRKSSEDTRAKVKNTSLLSFDADEDE